MSLAVQVAKAALLEVGRADLAERVQPNRAGWPSIRHGADDHDVIVKAFYLGHKATGHDCRIALAPDWHTDAMLPAILCETCEESWS